MSQLLRLTSTNVLPYTDQYGEHVIPLYCIQIINFTCKKQNTVLIYYVFRGLIYIFFSIMYHLFSSVMYNIFFCYVQLIFFWYDVFCLFVSVHIATTNNIKYAKHWLRKKRLCKKERPVPCQLSVYYLPCSAEHLDHVLVILSASLLSDLLLLTVNTTTSLMCICINNIYMYYNNSVPWIICVCLLKHTTIFKCDSWVGRRHRSVPYMSASLCRCHQNMLWSWQPCYLACTRLQAKTTATTDHLRPMWDLNLEVSSVCPLSQ